MFSYLLSVFLWFPLYFFLYMAYHIHVIALVIYLTEWDPRDFSTAETDPATMGSRYVPGLYFAGELLDVDGMCGGYNLTFAWASGYIAGRSTAE